MEMKVLTKNGKSVLSFKTDFNEVLDENFAAICEAIANKGKAIKELTSVFEKEDNSLDNIIQIMTTSRGENAAKNALSKELGISPQNAQYLLDMSLENLTALNVKKLKKMLDDYRTNISKLVV
jgi:DNA gyrase/topoisomerase IV subunit A